MKSRRIIFIALAMIVFLFFSSLFSSLRVLATDGSNVFWFVLIADTHIGDSDDCADNLSWLVNDGCRIIKPLTIINAGDLTEQKGFTSDHQEESQWSTYRQILENAKMDRMEGNVPVYADLPGNHDLWNEPIPLTNYLKYSIQGKNQDNWLYHPNYGLYQFITADTTDVDNANFLVDQPNCFGELDAAEIGFIENALKDNYQSVSHSFIFGHHALKEEVWGRIEDGHDEFIRLLNDYNVSFYGYGHTHKAKYVDSYYLNSETLVYNVKSLGKDDKYAIAAIDDNGISATEAGVGQWPVVIITAPLDKKLGGKNPFAKPLLTLEDTSIRALVFDENPVNGSQVKFQYKRDNVSAGWQNIPGDAVSPSETNPCLWQAKWDARLTPGNYLVRVEVKNRSDEINVALKPFLDVVLVIDTSGSMAGVAMSVAKTSAKSFVDLMLDYDKIGVVEFADAGWVVYQLNRIEAANNVKTAAKTAIDGLVAGGNTSIGAGLFIGQKEFEIRGPNDPVWTMILISDGEENKTPYAKDVLPKIMETKTKVYAIGLGEAVDEALLNTIALVTGGFYRFAPSVESLAAVYQDIQIAVSGLQGIAAFAGNIIQGASQVFTAGIDPGLIKAIFQARIRGSEIGLVLIDPNGQEINPTTAATNPNIVYTSNPAYKSYSILSPKPGEWQIKVTGVEVEPAGEPISVSVNAETDLVLSLDFDKIEYLPGNPIVASAEIKDSSGSVLNASIAAEVQTPSGSGTLVLFDDGAHQDRNANDGIYANSFAQTAERGSYTFKADASGVSNEGHNFTRTIAKSAVVGQDTDGDQMPDAWESVYGLDKYGNDAADDPDSDGLTNLEEYNYRTNPKKADTDGDGYTDKEELDNLSNPLDSFSIPIRAVCQNITVGLDQTGSVSVAAEQINNGSSAFAGIESIVVSPNVFTCENIGENNIFFIVTDKRGNNVQASAAVTVVDNLAPAPVIASLPTITAETGLTIAEKPIAWDNCAGEIIGQTESELVFDQLGEFTVVWTYDDGKGNIATQTQAVVIAPTAAVAPPKAKKGGKGGCFVEAIK